MKKQKSTTINISEVSSSDDESQAKPKIDKEELKKYIKDSDDESSQEQIHQNLLLKNQKSKERKLLNFKIHPPSNPIKQFPKK